MNYLKRGLKNTYRAIKKHKLIFLLLIFLQIVFIVILSTVSYKYQIKVLEDARGIMEPIEQGNYNASSIEQGQPFSPNTLEIYKSYQSLAKNILYLSIWFLCLFVIFNGALWILSHHILEEKIKNFLNAYLKIIVSFIVFIIPFFIAAYFFLKSLLKMDLPLEAISKYIQGTSYLLILFYFFLIVAFAFIFTKSWKEFLKSWFKVAIKNIHYSLLVLLINLVLIFVSLFLVSLYLNDETFFLMMLFSIILLVLLVVTRIFWIACLKEI
jgi:hypothetical protein